MLSFMTRGQEGAGIISRVWQQSTLPSCKPRYKCLMIFNDPGCTLTWKSNKCFEIPTRFNLLTAPESNSSLDLILDMRSNNIQILSSALVSLVVSTVLSYCVSKFFKNMFSLNSASPSDLMPLFGQRSVKKASEAQDENSGWDRAKESWFGAGSFAFQVNMILPTGYLKMLFLFIHYFLPIWTEKKY